MRTMGFVIHEETEPELRCNSLGYEIDGESGVVSPSRDKAAKLSAAFAWLSRRPRVSGQQVEKLIGHAVHVLLLRRELLSMFRSLYDFVHA